ncbi:hypothetical protein [Methanobrevibacter sp.]|uniref:hypothetical protein n=1 Tax=Methanobrevibacter sp. TaxID=66852 RepID=UPI0025D4DDD5|nr:hypothetical protein [Methanobrevibacter sp.]MBR6994260.1 hypothetical protein [Methanobrevibacter sp.]
MNARRFLISLTIILLIISSIAIVSAESDNIKTHEYNYANKAFFNISDDLTDEMEFKPSFFDSFEGGTYYTYPDEKSFCSLSVEGEDEPGDFETHKNNSSYEEMDSNATSQGYKTYIFKDSNEYVVFIDLDNITVAFNEGLDLQYNYFKGTFKTLDEAHIFIDTFRINETSTI